MSKSRTVKVSILGKDYQVNCQENELNALQRSATFLDDKMREMRDHSNVFGLDRLAVMAALNLTNDLLAQSDKANILDNQQIEMNHQLADQSAEIANLTKKVDSALERLKRDPA